MRSRITCVMVITFLFFSHFGLGQELDFRLGADVSLGQGADIIQWNYNSPMHNTSSKYKWSVNSKNYGLSASIVRNDRHVLGLKYTRQLDLISFQRDPLAQHVVGNGLDAQSEWHVKSDFISWFFVSLGLNAGYQQLRATKHALYLIQYSSPYTFNSLWQGFSYGGHFGFGFALPRDFGLRVLLQQDYKRLYLTNAQRVVDDEFLKATGHMRMRQTMILFEVFKRFKWKFDKSITQPTDFNP